MIYLLYFLVVTMLAIFVTQRKQALISVITLTFFYIALSYPAGNDWLGYFINYDCLINDRCYDDFIVFEPGYQLVVLITGQLGFQGILISLALLNAILLYKYARHFENGALVYIFIMCMFIWALHFEAIRQALALSITMYGIKSLAEKKIKRYIIIILLAAAFHITALICLLFIIPVYFPRLSKLSGYMMVGLGGLLVLILGSVLTVILSILPAGSLAYEKLNFYLSTEQYQPQLSIGIGTVLDIVLLFVIVISFSKIKKQHLVYNKNFLNITFLGVCIYVFFSIIIGKMMPVMTRIGWYGFPFVIIAIYSNIGESIYIKKCRRNAGVSFTVLCIYGYFILQIFRPFTYDYSNYNLMHQETIFQNINQMDDQSLRNAAKDKCSVLTKLGYGFLCSI